VAIANGRQRVVMAEQFVGAVDQVNFHPIPNPDSRSQNWAPREPTELQARERLAATRPFAGVYPRPARSRARALRLLNRSDVPKEDIDAWQEIDAHEEGRGLVEESGNAADP